MNHGTANAYSYWGCRCDECREFNRARTAQARRDRAARPKSPNDPRHGKPTFYGNHGCRCDKCKAAWSDKCKRNYDKRVSA